MTTLYTYDSNDITSAGWRVQTGPKRTVATYRNRWQGSLTGIKLTIYDGGALLAACEDNADDDYSVGMLLDMELDSMTEGLCADDNLRTGHSEHFNGWLVRVTSAGHTVA